MTKNLQNSAGDTGIRVKYCSVGCRSLPSPFPATGSIEEKPTCTDSLTHHPEAMMSFFDFLLSLCCLPEKSVMAEGLSRTGTFPFTAWSQGGTKLCEEVGLVYILGLLLPSDGSVKHAVQF